MGEGVLVQLFEFTLALFLEEDRLIRLVPDANALVMRGSDYEVASTCKSHGPDFAVVTAELLNLLELVTIPTLDCLILAGAKEDVFIVAVHRMRYEGDL